MCRIGRISTACRTPHPLPDAATQKRTAFPGRLGAQKDADPTLASNALTLQFHLLNSSKSMRLDDSEGTEDGCNDRGDAGSVGVVAPRGCPWMVCLGQSGARPVGCGQRPRAILGHGVSRPSLGAVAGEPMRCAISCATTMFTSSARAWQDHGLPGVGRLVMARALTRRPASINRSESRISCAGTILTNALANQP